MYRCRERNSNVFFSNRSGALCFLCAGKPCTRVRYGNVKRTTRNGRSEEYWNLVMESRIGLDYIVENPEYTAKLATGNSISLSYRRFGGRKRVPINAYLSFPGTFTVYEGTRGNFGASSFVRRRTRHLFVHPTYA